MATSGREKGFSGHPKGRPFAGGEHGGLHMATRHKEGHHNAGALHTGTKRSGSSADRPPKGGMPGVGQNKGGKMHAGGNAHSDGGMRHGTTKATGPMASRFDRMAKESSRYVPGKGHR